MKKLISILFFVLITTHAYAESCPDGVQFEENNILLLVDGQAVAGNIIGGDDPCDEFGGVEIFTPVNELRLYVNFNIAGTIKLDLIDTLFGKVSLLKKHIFANRTIAVINKRTYKRFSDFWGLTGLAFVNLRGDTFFVSEELLSDEAAFDATLADYFAGKYY